MPFSWHEAKGAYSPRELAPGNTALNFFSMESFGRPFLLSRYLAALNTAAGDEKVLGVK